MIIVAYWSSLSKQYLLFDVVSDECRSQTNEWNCVWLPRRLGTVS